MHDNEAVPRADAVRDLADPTHARRSLRASLDRRLKRARRRRAASGGRRTVVVATCLLALGAGGAMAHESGGTQAEPGSSRAKAADAGPRTSTATIKAVQRKLGITADGVAGRQTRRAIKRFQRREGLEVDGVIGPATLRALGIETSRGDEERTGDVAAQLARIAECESGGDPTAVSSDGTYRGKYQFSRATWEELGGEGDPAEASEAEQDLRAAALMERQGPSAWPVCAQDE